MATPPIGFLPSSPPVNVYSVVSVQPASRRRELVNRAVAVATAYVCCAVKIAGAIEGHAVLRRTTIAAASEAVKHTLRPAVAVRQLEYRSAHMRSAGVGCAVDITGRVEDEIAVIRMSAIATVKIVEDSQCPADATWLEERVVGSTFASPKSSTLPDRAG